MILDTCGPFEQGNWGKDTYNNSICIYKVCEEFIKIVIWFVQVQQYITTCGHMTDLFYAVGFKLKHRQ